MEHNKVNFKPVEVKKFSSINREAKRWLTPKKVVAVLVGSVSLTAVGVKAFEDEGSNNLEISGSPIEVDTNTSSPDTTVDSPSTTTIVDSLAPDNTSSPDSTFSGPDTTLYNPDTTYPNATSPETTDPIATNPPDTTYPEVTSPDTTYPEPEPQDVYKDICEPLRWETCGEYEIYDENGNWVNRVIANSAWTTQYIASISGGGENGSSVKIREVFPR